MNPPSLAPRATATRPRTLPCSPRRLSWLAELPWPCAPPPAPILPSKLAPSSTSPSALAYKGQSPASRAPRKLEPPPPLPDAAGAPWSHHPGPFLPKSNPPRAWPLPTEAPRSDFALPASPEKHRRRPVPPLSAPRRGEPSSDHLRSSHDHPRVALEPHSIFPHFPLAAGQPPLREPPHKPCSVLSFPPGTPS